MNEEITGNKILFQHGGNDDYILKDTKDRFLYYDDGTPKMGRNPDDSRIPDNTTGKDENYIIATPNGEVMIIEKTANLQKFCEQHGIPWPYYPSHGNN